MSGGQFSGGSSTWAMGLVGEIELGLSFFIIAPHAANEVHDRHLDTISLAYSLLVS